MRCARCQHVWTPDQPAPAAPVREEPVASTWTERAEPETRLAYAAPPMRAGLGVAWFATIVVVLGTLIAALTQREAVMAAWPPAARAYAALGLH